MLKAILILLLAPLIITFATIFIMMIIGATWGAVLKITFVVLAISLVISILKDKKKEEA
ncbi:MAG: hypothetical protein J6Y02_01335 [Pseudobutyrivibrio sp.]|nr:hypothetical protein [Pseudobutyrivibrio sp.]